jgi:hypothetical protein
MPGLPVVAITNESSVLADDEIKAVLPALQRQVDLDVYGYWGVTCTLQFWPKTDAMVEGWWQIVIVDDPDQAGALGYHEMTIHGGPLGKVFAKLDIVNGLSWTVTLSHELLEMLVDPWINYCAQGSDGKIYALEICDPVEADGYGYLIDGVQVSDFLTPAWFEPTWNDRYDFKNRTSHPLEIMKDGYISVLGSTGWEQIADREFNPELMKVNLLCPEGSRRYRRGISKMEWRWSLR